MHVTREADTSNFSAVRRWPAWATEPSVQLDQWICSMQLSVDGPRSAGLVIWPFQIVAEDQQCSVNAPLTAL